jgi:hypothetical protein
MLTTIRYVVRIHNNTPDEKFSDNRSRSTFSTLHASNNYDDDDDYNEVNDNDDTNASNRYKPVKDLPTATHPLNATADVNPFRSAIAATFRGYCCELFVFGACTKLNSGCTYDHSAAGQEICINSFVLLSKRELTAHSQLPQAPTPNDFVATHKAPSTQSQFSRSNSQVFTQPRTYGQSAPLSTHCNSHHSTPNSILRNNAQFDAHEPSLTDMRATLNPPNNPILPIETT